MLKDKEEAKKMDSYSLRANSLRWHAIKAKLGRLMLFQESYQHIFFESDLSLKGSSRLTN